MTVEELIEKLEKQDPSQRVWFMGGDPIEIEIIEGVCIGDEGVVLY